MYQSEYDTSYDPAMPVVEIEISNLDEPSQSVKLLALVDSGADITFIPEKHLKAVKAESVRKGNVRGIWGNSQPADIYMIKMAIGPYEFFGVRVVGDKRGQTILGRNILNEVIVTLNGLANVVELSQ